MSDLLNKFQSAYASSSDENEDNSQPIKVEKREPEIKPVQPIKQMLGKRGNFNRVLIGSSDEEEEGGLMKQARQLISQRDATTKV